MDETEEDTNISMSVSVSTNNETQDPLSPLPSTSTADDAAAAVSSRLLLLDGTYCKHLPEESYGNIFVWSTMNEWNGVKETFVPETSGPTHLVGNVYDAFRSGRFFIVPYSRRNESVCPGDSEGTISSLLVQHECP